MNISPEIVQDISEVVHYLKTNDVDFTEQQYDEKAFGNFYLDFTYKNQKARITKDRAQYSIESSMNLPVAENNQQLYESIKRLISKV